MPKRVNVPPISSTPLEEVYRELVQTHSEDGEFVKLEDVKRRMCERFEEKRRHG